MIKRQARLFGSPGRGAQTPSSQPPYTAIVRLCLRRSSGRSAKMTPSFYHGACCYIPPWSLVRNATSSAPGAHAPNALPAPDTPGKFRRGGEGGAEVYAEPYTSEAWFPRKAGRQSAGPTKGPESMVARISSRKRDARKRNFKVGIAGMELESAGNRRVHHPCAGWK